MSQAALRPCWDAAAESRAPAEQQRLRLEGVRRVLNWVGEHSPFYRERLRKAGVDPRGIRTLDDFAAAIYGSKRMAYRKAILMGAALGAEARAEFREESGIEVYTLSGQGSDFNLFGTQCDRHDGEHWHADDLTLVELIDPNTGTPAEEGELGELVITDFYRRATPHVRWRTEDLYRMHSGPCACGWWTKKRSCFGLLT